MAGYSMDCLYQIGKTPKSLFTKAQLDSLENEGLLLVFNYAKDNSESDKLVGAWGTKKYGPSQKVFRGDPMEKAVKVYGKPKATFVRYWKDEKHGIDWAAEGLFYNDLTVLPDSSKTRVGGIVVGKMFSVSKAYIVR